MENTNTITENVRNRCYECCCYQQEDLLIEDDNFCHECCEDVNCNKDHDIYSN